ncbi:MAG TPA: hypothetical protein VJ967_00770 [Clostridia bacterium]|nr:hypothetical protein [Clostridia bacterium]
MSSDKEDGAAHLPLVLRGKEKPCRLGIPFAGAVMVRNVKEHKALDSMN